MTLEEFAARRSPLWVELEQSITHARRGRLRSTSAQELERFGQLYRRATSDLAIAARDFPGTPTTEYLNALCARAHPLLYRGRPARPASLLDFYARGLPRRFRAASPYMLISLGLLLGGAVAGWTTVEFRPDLAGQIVPQSPFEQLAQGHGVDLGNLPLVASVIITNNIKVALIAFAGGVSFGLLTAAMLLANGWQLGALGAAIHAEGYDAPFWSIILPHGVLELSIIVFAGGSGLMMAGALLRPGLHRRLDALSEAAGRAVILAVGLAPLLLVCGLIEAFVSPSGAPMAVKFGVALLSGVLLYGWLLLAGRQPPAPGAALCLGESPPLAVDPPAGPA